MNTTTTYDTVWALRRSWENSGISQPIADHVGEAIWKLAQLEEQLDSQAVEVQRRVAQLRDELARGLHVNSLGELQSSGPRLDALCALREQQIETVHRAIALLPDEEAIEARRFAFPTSDWS